jgi:hypothetical protein
MRNKVITHCMWEEKRLFLPYKRILIKFISNFVSTETKKEICYNPHFARRKHICSSTFC